MRYKIDVLPKYLHLRENIWIISFVLHSTLILIWGFRGFLFFSMFTESKNLCSLCHLCDLIVFVLVIVNVIIEVYLLPHVAQMALLYIQRRHSLTPSILHYARHPWGYLLHRVLPLGRALHSLSQYHHHCMCLPSLYHEVARMTHLWSDADVSPPLFPAPRH